ncbi:MAG: hypothetical protein IKS28_01105 [Clostridia bacterium]|nr:hypothetical protein [Clostridia bacterium]
MKKSFGILFTLLTLLMMSVSVFAEDKEFDKNGMRVCYVNQADNIVIDGIRDEAYQHSYVVDNKIRFSGKEGEPITGNIAFAWNANKLFIHYEVFDTTPVETGNMPYEVDNTEFTIDWNADKGALDRRDYRFRCMVNGVGWDKWYWETKYTWQDETLDRPDISMIDYVIIASDGGEWSMDRVGDGVHYIIEFSVEVPYTITELYPGKIVYYDHQTGDNQLDQMSINYAISMGPGSNYLAFSTADACHVKLVLTDAEGRTDGKPSGTMPTTEDESETYIEPELEAPVPENPFIDSVNETTGDDETDNIDTGVANRATVIVIVAVIIVVITFVIVFLTKKKQKK